jgi:succinylarginine dihydrolase
MQRDVPGEVNFDGLVGPTHHYGGLGIGNLASQRHRHEVANPRAAALEGLAKMRLMLDLGLPQAVLPPQPRPLVPALRRLGFSGDDAAVLATAARDAPDLLAACASTSNMWAANAATVSPAADTADGRVHLTPANLVSQLHRALETPATTAVLTRIFADASRFVVHEPLPATLQIADEGAANHVRLAPAHGQPGIEIFVDGRAGDQRPREPAGETTLEPAAETTREPADRKPQGGRFPARQSRAASAAVARLHGLDPARTLFLRQSDAALDAGVFHNDVIAVGNEHVLLVHEEAWADGPAALDAVRRCYAAAGDAARDRPLVVIEVPAAEVPLATAVETYLFNSQLVTLPAGGMALICPVECREHPATSRWLDRILEADNPIVAVHPIDVRQSMRNGGGPACLRLRVVLTAADLAALDGRVLLTPERLAALEAWVRRHYREELTVADLADPALLAESRKALEELELPGLPEEKGASHQMWGI